MCMILQMMMTTMISGVEWKAQKCASAVKKKERNWHEQTGPLLFFPLPYLEASTGSASGGAFPAETEEAFESFAVPE